MKRSTLFLACGVASPLVYIGTDVFASLRYPGYNYVDQAVSELFAIDAPTSAIVVRLFTLSSALLLLLAIGVWRSAGQSWALRVTAILFVVSAFDALVLWNFFPMHMRGVPRSMTDTMHLILAANPSVVLTLIFVSIARRDWLRTYTLATLVAILVLAVYGFSYANAVALNAPTPWMGLSERIGQYTYGVWGAVFAIALMKSGSVPVRAAHRGGTFRPANT